MPPITHLVPAGILGFLIIGVVIFARIIKDEQRREGKPRSQIIILCALFIILNISVAGAGTYIELQNIRMKRETSGCATHTELNEKLAQRVENLSVALTKANEDNLTLKSDLTRAHNDAKLSDAEIARLNAQIRQIGVSLSQCFDEICATVNLDKVEVLKKLKNLSIFSVFSREKQAT